MELPAFRYHPDPIMSGSVVASDKKCKSCKQARGAMYVGPVYAEKDLDESLCPWCIADGSAAKKFDATFVDSEAFDGDLPDETMNEIVERTPGYAAWQGERWLTCCDDAMALVEPAGAEEIQTKYLRLEGTLITYIVQELGISGGAAHQLLRSLKRDAGPTAYVFRCLHCETLNAYIDQG